MTSRISEMRALRIQPELDPRRWCPRVRPGPAALQDAVPLDLHGLDQPLEVLAVVAPAGVNRGGPDVGRPELVLGEDLEPGMECCRGSCAAAGWWGSIAGAVVPEAFGSAGATPLAPSTFSWIGLRAVVHRLGPGRPVGVRIRALSLVGARERQDLFLLGRRRLRAWAGRPWPERPAAGAAAFPGSRSTICVVLISFCPSIAGHVALPVRGRLLLGDLLVLGARNWSCVVRGHCCSRSGSASTNFFGGLGGGGFLAAMSWASSRC